MTIIYFSATGNSKYVANRIAKNNDKFLYIPDSIKENIFEIKDESVGIISPTYAWGIPSIVFDYLKKVKIISNYLFYISTYGTTPGSSSLMIKKILPSINAFYSVQMVDTWTVLFDLSNKEKVNKWTKNTEKEIDEIIKNINARKEGNFMQRKMPICIGSFVYKQYDNMRKTSNFNVENSCIGCGLCAKKCPVNAIQIVNKKPVWIKNECVMCLGCLHRCPKFAIQYKNKTKNHGQYQNPNAKI